MKLAFSRLVLAAVIIIIPCLGSAYVVVLKDGKTVRGSLLRETDDAVLVKDSSNLFVNIRKSDIDVERTAAENKKADGVSDTGQASKKAARVVTREELEKLRDKYDLGLKSFGEYSPVRLSEEPIVDSPAGNDDFERQVLRADVPVIVDFWAPWCGACRKLAPVIDAVAAEYSGKATVFRVNIDKRKDLAKEYGIQAIPTLLFFKDGQIAETLVGAAPKEVISERLESLL